jgi:hypothetical protein
MKKTRINPGNHLEPGGLLALVEVFVLSPGETDKNENLIRRGGER